MIHGSSDLTPGATTSTLRAKSARQRSARQTLGQLSRPLAQIRRGEGRANCPRLSSARDTGQLAVKSAPLGRGLALRIHGANDHLSGGPAAWAEATGMGRTDQPEPDLGLGVASEQPMRSGNLVCIGLESACLDIDGDKFAGVLCAEMRLYLALIDLVAPPGELFLAIPRIRGCAHGTILRQRAPNVTRAHAADDRGPARRTERTSRAGPGR